MLPIIILAAGKSRRFGDSDKRFTVLPHGGVLINALVRRAKKTGLDVSVVINAKDMIADKIDAPCIVAPNAEQGMGASIADAVSVFAKRSAAESLLIMPADLPLLRIESLRRVAASAAPNRIIVPECEGRRGHPVAFGRQFWPLLRELTGDEGARSVIANHHESVDIVEVQDEGIYRDADTPEEMRAVLSKLRPTLR
ncbi:nucleotidyltransferase family protein [Zhongshania marina]|nr:nucleotidyltransferase family protein [Marortus luteolus]